MEGVMIVSILTLLRFVIPVLLLLLVGELVRYYAKGTGKPVRIK